MHFNFSCRCLCLLICLSQYVCMRMCMYMYAYICDLLMVDILLFCLYRCIEIYVFAYVFVYVCVCLCVDFFVYCVYACMVLHLCLNGYIRVWVLSAFLSPWLMYILIHRSCFQLHAFPINCHSLLVFSLAFRWTNERLGTVVFELYWQHAPRTCFNFRQLAEKKYYDNTTFHRVIKVKRGKQEEEGELETV